MRRFNEDSMTRRTLEISAPIQQPVVSSDYKTCSRNTTRIVTMEYRGYMPQSHASGVLVVTYLLNIQIIAARQLHSLSSGLVPSRLGR